MELIAILPRRSEWYSQLDEVVSVEVDDQNVLLARADGGAARFRFWSRDRDAIVAALVMCGLDVKQVEHISWLDDARIFGEVLSELDDLVAVTSGPLPDDERVHGWTDREWGEISRLLSEWRDRLSRRGFLGSEDVSWQTRSLFAFDHVDTGYGVALALVVLATRISDALNRNNT